MLRFQATSGAMIQFDDVYDGGFNRLLYLRPHTVLKPLISALTLSRSPKQSIAVMYTTIFHGDKKVDS